MYIYIYIRICIYIYIIFIYVYIYLYIYVYIHIYTIWGWFFAHFDQIWRSWNLGECQWQQQWTYIKQMTTRIWVNKCTEVNQNGESTTQAVQLATQPEVGTTGDAAGSLYWNDEKPHHKSVSCGLNQEVFNLRLRPPEGEQAKVVTKSTVFKCVGKILQMGKFKGFEWWSRSHLGSPCMITLSWRMVQMPWVP